MLLYGQRIGSAVRSIVPRGDGTPADDYPTRVQRAVFGYVRGQLLFSLIMGTSAGAMLWIAGSLGIFPDGKTYALVFGAWFGFAELIPYVGSGDRGAAADHRRAVLRQPGRRGLARDHVHGAPAARGPRRRADRVLAGVADQSAARDLRPPDRRAALRLRRGVPRPAARRRGAGDVHVFREHLSSSPGARRRRRHWGQPVGGTFTRCAGARSTTGSARSSTGTERRPPEQRDRRRERTPVRDAGAVRAPQRPRVPGVRRGRRPGRRLLQGLRDRARGSATRPPPRRRPRRRS